jgi:hypothetical protein
MLERVKIIYKGLKQRVKSIFLIFLYNFADVILNHGVRTGSSHGVSDDIWAICAASRTGLVASRVAHPGLPAFFAEAVVAFCDYRVAVGVGIQADNTSFVAIGLKSCLSDGTLFNINGLIKLPRHPISTLSQWCPFCESEFVNLTK